jgi:hypothetical protein
VLPLLLLLLLLILHYAAAAAITPTHPPQSLPSIIFVESAEGDTLGLITNRSQLDALMVSLNKRGTRESALHQVSRKYSTLQGGVDHCN